MSATDQPSTDMHPQRLKHLEMLQQIISRMANNSFLIKGWSLTLISAILTFSTATKDITQGNMYFVLLIALLPALAFWYLDAYFLRQERLFRKLYDHYRTEQITTPSDFSMNTAPVEDNVASLGQVMVSHTLRLFYGTLTIIVLVIIGCAKLLT